MSDQANRDQPKQEWVKAEVWRLDAGNAEAQINNVNPDVGVSKS
jgi:hypothetical protein